MNFATDIRVRFRMTSNNFDDLLTFDLAPSSGQNLNLSNILLYDPTESLAKL